MPERSDGSSIWIFVAGFLLLGVVGIAFLILVGSPSGDTEPASHAYWEDNPPASVRSDTASGRRSDPAKGGTRAVEDHGAEAGVAADPTPGTTKGEATSKGQAALKGQSASPPVTFPGGQPAPPDVTKVLHQNGSIALAFRIEKGALGDEPHAVIPPMRTKVPPNSSSIVVWIGCAQSSLESLAQVSVAETAQQVTVSAVVLVPANSVGCDSSASPRELTIPLESPVGNRAVVVVPTTTRLPKVEQG